MKIGDKVIITSQGASLEMGCIGTIKKISRIGAFGVDFPCLEKRGIGHDLSGAIKTQTGWYLRSEQIRLLSCICR